MGLVALALELALCAPSYSQQSLADIEGKWLSTTPGSTGEPIWFTKAFGGYDALIP